MQNSSIAAKKRSSLNSKSPSLPMLSKLQSNFYGSNRPKNSKSFIVNISPKNLIQKQSQTPTPKLPKIAGMGILTQHPFRHLIFSPVVNEDTFKSHLKVTQQGLKFSKSHLKKISESILKTKQIQLPNLKITKSKTIFLDLDETLIHCCSYYEQPDYTIESPEVGEVFFKNYLTISVKIPIKVRPFCLEFLKQLSSYYDIFVFTASSSNYANAVISWLDKETKYIKGIYSREHCIETKEGLYFKNLRIFANQQLKNMLIVDNLSHSFGYHIFNGVPILEWTSDKSDQELVHLLEYLKEASRFEDIRIYNKEMLKLDQLINYDLIDD